MRRARITLLELITVLVLVSVLYLGLIAWISHEKRRPQPIIDTAIRLRALDVLMKAYYDSEGVYPTVDRWQSELQITPHFDESLFTDHWGNDVVYIAIDDGNCPVRYLYSVGENGQDDYLVGDDIVLLPSGEIATERERQQTASQ